MKSLYGTGVALVTPFKNDLSIDTEALSRIVNHSIEGGIDYLVVLGTTAESATLSVKDKETVKAVISEANHGRVPMVLGIGGNNTTAVLHELQTSSIDAYEAVLSVSPYYNKPTQEGIYQHFKAVAEESPKPIILYNVPGRTASNMHPQTVLRLAHDFSKTIIGIKEAAGDMVQAMQLIKDKPKDFLVISGDDITALPMILAGGAGVISVIGQGFPKAFSQMVRLGIEGKVAAAYELQYKLMEIIDLIFEEGNPAGIKAVFNTLGISGDDVRLPLLKVSSGLKTKITDFTHNFKA